MSGAGVRRRFTRISLRGRLLAITASLLVVALLGSNALVIGVLRRDLVRQLDGRIGTAASVIARILTLPSLPDLGGQAAPQVRASVEQQLIGDIYFAYLTPGGRVERVIRPAEGDSPDLSRLDAKRVAEHGGRPFQVAASGGGDWRVIAVPRLGAGGGSDGSVVVAASLDVVDATIGRLAGEILLIDSAVLALLALAGWFAVQGGMRPLRRVETTAAAIAGGDLSRRVPDLAGPATELGRLTAALNGMLAQIEAGAAVRADSERRMRRFIADASHELRTPLFGIKGLTELYRMGGMPERADVDASMGRIEREAARLVRLVEDLLLLARLDEHGGATTHLPLHLTPMDLRTLAADALHDLRAIDPDRPVTLTGPGGGPPGSAPVLGDEARLRQVTSNLVGNAVAHTPPGIPVRIGVGTEDGHAVFELHDEGPGMTDAQAAQVFERFYRADGARARSGGGGAGLGLAIVDSLVKAHGGRVEVRTAPGAGADFRVLLPQAESEP